VSQVRCEGCRGEAIIIFEPEPGYRWGSCLGCSLDGLGELLGAMPERLAQANCGAALEIGRLHAELEALRPKLCGCGRPITGRGATVCLQCWDAW
jgi:hypothetical protein